MKARQSAHAVLGVMAVILRPAMNLLMGHRWAGVENLPKDRGFIICPNHVTEIDPIVVGHYLYNHGVMPHFLAKASLFRIPVLGAVLRASRQVPVERTAGGGNRSLEVAREVLDDGGGIIIYPEGTLTRDPDMWPMKGRTGAARLALQTGAPVIPVAHWGAQQVFPRYAKRLHVFPRATVRVLAGPPVDLSEYMDRPLDRETLTAATDKILDAVTALLAELRGETPPDFRWDPVSKNQKLHGRDYEQPGEQP